MVFAIIFLLLLFIFYLGVCLYRKDMTFAADFQKVMFLFACVHAPRRLVCACASCEHGSCCP